MKFYIFVRFFFARLTFCHFKLSQNFAALDTESCLEQTLDHKFCKLKKYAKDHKNAEMRILIINLIVNFLQFLRNSFCLGPLTPKLFGSIKQ